MVRAGKPTLYELVASHADGRRVLVAYCSRKGRRDLWRAVTSDKRRDAVVRLFGPEITFARRAAEGARMGDWTLRFSGRTERDCEGRELDYVGTLAPDAGTLTDGWWIKL